MEVVLLFTVFLIGYLIHSIRDLGSDKPTRTIGDRLSGQCTPIEYEEKTARYLRHHGYSSAEVTRASGDFGADVIAEKWTGRKLAVQCKMYSKSVGVRAVEEVLAARSFYHCEDAAVFASSGFTRAAIKMAQETGVKLYVFDRKYCLKIER